MLYWKLPGRSGDACRALKCENKFNDREEWCLIVDRFATGKGYLPLVTKSLKTGAFTVLNDTQFDMGVTKKRHGGIIPITEEEYQRLCK